MYGWMFVDSWRGGAAIHRYMSWRLGWFFHKIAIQGLRALGAAVTAIMLRRNVISLRSNSSQQM